MQTQRPLKEWIKKGDFNSIDLHVHLRYPIDQTSIKINLTKITHAPTLSRNSLLALVEWVSKNKNRSECIEFHGMGSNSHGESLSAGQFAGKSSAETSKTTTRGEQSC